MKATGKITTERGGFTFIEKYLKESGLEVMRDKDIFYTCLAQNRDCIIGMKNGKLKIAVALSINEEDTDLFSAMGHPFQQLFEMMSRSSFTSGSSFV